jgi:hypothetical protein
MGKPLLITHKGGKYSYEETRTKSVRLSPKEILDILREGQEEIQFLEAGESAHVPLSAESAFDGVIEALQRFSSVVGDTHGDRMWRTPDLIIGDAIAPGEIAQESLIEQKVIPYKRNKLPRNETLWGWANFVLENVSLLKKVYLEGKVYPDWQEYYSELLNFLRDFGYLHTDSTPVPLSLKQLRQKRYKRRKRQTRQGKSSEI